MRFKQFDLNQLIILDALLREHSVTRAARQLNLSQPAMSSALARLRAYLNDDILVQHGKKMVPTSHALDMAPKVRKALEDIENIVTSSTVFDPASSQYRFRICASDYVTVVLLQPLLAKLERLAPGVSMDISPPAPEALARLEHGEIDFLLTPDQFTASAHPKHLLFEEQHVVVGCRKNPVFKKALTEEIFFDQGHVVIELNHAQTFAEQQIGKLNPRRHVEVVCPSFLAVPWMLMNTRRLAVMHERLARYMVKILPLKTAPLPFTLPPMQEMVQYHSARKTDGGVQWMLRCIQEQAVTLRAI